MEKVKSNKIDSRDIHEVEISTDERFEWYALMCIPNHEKSVKKTIDSNLELANLKDWVDIVHVPTMKDVQMKDGKRIVKEKVMINGYILVHMDLENGEVMPCIRASKGVSGWLNPSDGKLKQRPERMRDRDVKRFLNVAVENNEAVSIDYVVGERVEIINGAFATFIGTIDTISNGKVSVTTEIFDRETQVELVVGDIQKAKKQS